MTDTPDKTKAVMHRRQPLLHMYLPAIVEDGAHQSILLDGHDTDRQPKPSES
jgi:hypothetical protein